MRIIYTGNGKGKTSAALGTMLRMTGYLRKTCLIQFIKDGSQYGEHHAVNHFLGDFVDMYQAGMGFYQLPEDEHEDIDHRKAAEEALELAKEKIRSKQYDLLILDEILTAVTVQLLTERDILEIMKYTPEELHLVLTGRGASEAMVRAADLVTEMKEIKHPFQENKNAAEGIDY
jgi:cob(I)alamin adenosyltransferase